MKKQPGPFVVIEGLDGAGTTTQTARLAACLETSRIPVFKTYEPTGGPIGTLIRRILTRRESVDGAPFQPGEASLALLFAADRLAHTYEIARRREESDCVVCDRYILSSMAYQSLGSTIDGQRVVELNAGCAAPSLTLFFDVPVAECLRRLDHRGDTDSIYERGEILERIRKNYVSLVPLYTRHFGPLETIDGAADADTVHAAVVDAVRHHFGLNIPVDQ